MEDNDDDLKLDAWQPPAPPPGLAANVVSRMHIPVSTAVEIRPPWRHRRWLARTAIAFLVVSMPAAAYFGAGYEADGRAELGQEQMRSSHLMGELIAVQQKVKDVQGEADRTRAQLVALEQRLADQVGGGPADAVHSPAPAPADAVHSPPSKPAPAPAPPPKKTACDADQLTQRADKEAQSGQEAAALLDYEAAIACTPDRNLEKFAFMAACQSKNAGKARAYFKRLDPPTQQAMSQICVRAGIALPDPPVAPPPCDAGQLSKQAEQAAQAGNDAEALRLYERTQQCKADPKLDRLLFMYACRSKNVDKAKHYWGLIASSVSNSVRQICVRNGITDLP
jgi:hypothetical protein